MNEQTLNIFQDWKCNKGNLKGQMVMLFFRLAHVIRNRFFFLVLGFPFLIFYRFFVEWLLGIELHWNAQIGRDCYLTHGQGTVINGGAIIGKSCSIRHCTTIGNKKLSNGEFSACPVLGNCVDIGVGVTIIGDIVIGDNVKIGAGTIVLKDIPSNTVVVGNPGRIIGE